MSNFRYFFEVTHADNRLKARVNGNNFYNKYTDGDPVLNDSVEITDYLQATPSTNVVQVEGYNGPTTISTPAHHNPFNFSYAIVKVNITTGARITIAHNHSAGNHTTKPTAEYLVASWNHTIVKD